MAGSIVRAHKGGGIDIMFEVPLVNEANSYVVNLNFNQALALAKRIQEALNWAQDTDREKEWEW